jgi:hypothetical protein
LDLSPQHYTQQPRWQQDHYDAIKICFEITWTHLDRLRVCSSNYHGLIKCCQPRWQPKTIILCSWKNNWNKRPIHSIRYTLTQNEDWWCFLKTPSDFYHWMILHLDDNLRHKKYHTIEIEQHLVIYYEIKTLTFWTITDRERSVTVLLLWLSILFYYTGFNAFKSIVTMFISLSSRCTLRSYSCPTWSRTISSMLCDESHRHFFYWGKSTLIDCL